MSDRITIEGLRVFGKHGVEPSEREYGQDFLVDVECRLDASEAARSDSLESTVDYAGLAADVRRVVETETYFLLEALAEHICRMVLGHAMVKVVTVAIYKPEVAAQLGAERIGVRVRRRRK